MARGRVEKRRPRRGTAPPPQEGSSPTDPSGSGLQDEVVRLRSEVDKLTGLYRDLLGRLATFATMEESYLRLVALYARYGVISPELLVPEAKDPIAREVIRVLAMISEGSVQQITERLREARGSSSRRIVRARLGELQHLGAVEIRSSPKGRVTWRLSDEVVRKWSRMLGLAK